MSGEEFSDCPMILSQQQGQEEEEGNDFLKTYLLSPNLFPSPDRIMRNTFHQFCIHQNIPPPPSPAYSDTLWYPSPPSTSTPTPSAPVSAERDLRYFLSLMLDVELFEVPTQQFSNSFKQHEKSLELLLHENPIFFSNLDDCEDQLYSELVEMIKYIPWGKYRVMSSMDLVRYICFPPRGSSFLDDMLKTISEVICTRLEEAAKALSDETRSLSKIHLGMQTTSAITTKHDIAKLEIVSEGGVTIMILRRWKTKGRLISVESICRELDIPRWNSNNRSKSELSPYAKRILASRKTGMPPKLPIMTMQETPPSTERVEMVNSVNEEAVGNLDDVNHGMHEDKEKVHDHAISDAENICASELSLEAATAEQQNNRKTSLRNCASSHKSLNSENHQMHANTVNEEAAGNVDDVNHGMHEDKEKVHAYAISDGENIYTSELSLEVVAAEQQNNRKTSLRICASSSKSLNSENHQMYDANIMNEEAVGNLDDVNHGMHEDEEKVHAHATSDGGNISGSTKLKKPRSSGKLITLAAIEQYHDKTLVEAANGLGVCRSTLKR